MHLQIVVAGAGDGQLEEVQADAPAATPPTWGGERKRQAGRRHVICLDGAHLLFDSEELAAETGTSRTFHANVRWSQRPGP